MLDTVFIMYLVRVYYTSELEFREMLVLKVAK